ncbi:reverse transcriptase domain-containing protein [Tanacetum coccineum]
MVPATTHLIGFSGETIWPLGQIALLVKIGDETHSTSAWMNFMVIRSPSQHNAIIGRPGIRKIRAVPSTAHGMLKFPVEGGTVTLKSSRVIPLECAMISGPSIQPPTAKQVLEEKIKIAIHPEYPEQTVAIGSTLTEKGRKELCALLKQNLDIFAWKPADMTGVPRNIAEHRLNIREGYSPVRQKKRGQAPERNKAIQEEVEKLVDAGIMKEVHYHSWLSNPVMVKKHDGTWRMCVDFKDLNNACPKDCYPLPEIDWKVESLCGFPFKCFLDAYKGYHQIKMAKEDEEKTAFITSQGIFCYSKMPFGLKNAGSTYQRLVDKAFQRQIGRNLEVYVDDLVIKSRTEEEIIRDITETFKTLRQINMKLNPKKCTFGMQEGMFLGYKVSTNGLKACPDKADAVLSLPSPRCIKDVQKLNGKLATIFQWTPEAEEAFKQMKRLIAELPTLTAPREREELIIYLAAAKEAISAVLMTDREGRQIPVYFVSRTLRGPEGQLYPYEKSGEELGGVKGLGEELRQSLRSSFHKLQQCLVPGFPSISVTLVVVGVGPRIIVFADASVLPRNGASGSQNSGYMPFTPDQVMKLMSHISEKTGAGGTGIGSSSDTDDSQSNFSKSSSDTDEVARHEQTSNEGNPLSATLPDTIDSNNDNFINGGSEDNLDQDNSNVIRREGIDYDETFSPVVKIATVRCLVSLVVNKGWTLYQLDVNNAFLYGDLDDDVYMSLSEGRRAFLALLVYVDDTILTGNNIDEINKFKEFLKTNFLIKDLGKLKYFLGIEVVDTDIGLYLNQRKYCLEVLAEYGLLASKPTSTPIETNTVISDIVKRKKKKRSVEKLDPPLTNLTGYQKLLGKLIYRPLPDLTSLTQFIH